jgi:hypothetical protein
VKATSLAPPAPSPTHTAAAHTLTFSNKGHGMGVAGSFKHMMSSLLGSHSHDPHHQQPSSKQPSSKHSQQPHSHKSMQQLQHQKSAAENMKLLLQAGTIYSARICFFRVPVLCRGCLCISVGCGCTTCLDQIIGRFLYCDRS